MFWEVQLEKLSRIVYWQCFEYALGSCHTSIMKRGLADEYPRRDNVYIMLSRYVNKLTALEHIRTRLCGYVPNDRRGNIVSFSAYAIYSGKVYLCNDNTHSKNA